MIGDLARIISQYGIEEVMPILFVVTLRPLGLLFGFGLFSWAFRGARTVRISIAIALGLPTLALTIPDIELLIAQATFGRIAWLAPKEIMLGMAMGFLATLPFWALRYAGSIVAVYKGESDGGFQDPEGGTFESTALLFQLIGMAAFVNADGLWLTVANLYKSYQIWPLNSPFPLVAFETSTLLFGILTTTLVTAIRTALPLLAILIFIDFTLAVATRIGRQIKLYDHAFAVKNLAALSLMPMFAYLIWIINADIGLVSADGFSFLKAVLNE
ncbi:flagellar biosynthetic protein FliR [Yoonia sp.]|uniref:flagellar biosynthetic protein FliR n=1 Tax=Yoonia sp. TaxID=2212373 RepID=UPI0025FF8040|nr:flagellar biosynthetic protein FliR [Yoonia sp.]